MTRLETWLYKNIGIQQIVVKNETRLEVEKLYKQEIKL